MATRRRSLRKFHFAGTACHEYSYARRMALLALAPSQAFAKAFGEILRGLEQQKHFNFREESELVRWLDVVDERDIEETLTASSFHQAIVKAASKQSKVAVSTSCRRNIDWLCDLISLGRVEADLLELIVAIRQNDMLSNAIDRCGGKTIRTDGELLGRLIGATTSTVVSALSRHGNLTRYGFIRYDHGFENFPSRLEMPSEILGKLTHPYGSKAEFVDAFLNPAEPVLLSVDDMPHLAGHLETLARVLPNALVSQERGINILLHGEPGTGKTQFASILAGLSGVSAYRIVKPDENDPQTGVDRLGYYAIVQQMLRHRGSAVLVFDEFEDVVPDDNPLAGMFGGQERRSAPMKSWLTQILESNPVPTIWICNKIRHIDRALLRRFIYAIEFRTPPSSVRRRILTKAVEGINVRPPWIERKAHVANLSPALVRNAARIAKLAGGADAAANEALLDCTIAGSLNALGEQPAHTGLVPATRYDLAFVNATPGPETVASSLERAGRGTLCFYGPPGTGKTAFAGHLARELDRPLLIKRASDLLSMWVGEAEKNIAGAFQEARDENAVLLIDEADSFLANRAGAQRNWEVTQVNEMLQQIEHFDGVLICTTNRIDQMDPAVLRRFSHKVGFCYLRPEQRLAMFFSEFGDAFPEASYGAAASATLCLTDNLAPGDFATARKQFDACGRTMDLQDLLALLASECEMKPDRPRRAIGFT